MNHGIESDSAFGTGGALSQQPLDVTPPQNDSLFEEESSTAAPPKQREYPD